MKEKDIKMGLECCIGYSECSKCPFNSSAAGTIECKSELMREALDLINRQKTEMDRLKREIENLESTQEITPDVKYFVDTKADKVISLLNEAIKSQEQIKAEAIKEFADKVKEYFNPDSSYEIRQYIDNLVKEMTGEQQ